MAPQLPRPPKPPVQHKAPVARPAPPKPPAPKRYELLFSHCRPCRMTKHKNQTHYGMAGDVVLFIRQHHTPEGQPAAATVKHQETGEEFRVFPQDLKPL